MRPILALNHRSPRSLTLRSLPSRALRTHTLRQVEAISAAWSHSDSVSFSQINGEFALRAKVDTLENGRIAVCAPFAKAITYEFTEKYCAHCCRELGDFGVPSRYTYDYFGYKTCRDLFDRRERRAASILRNEFRSRYHFIDESLGYSVEGVNMHASLKDLSLVRLVAEVISKIHVEHSGAESTNTQIELIDHVCVEDAASTQWIYFPTKEDFFALRAGITVPKERVQKLAQLVWVVLKEHKDLPLIPDSEEEVLKLVSRVEENRIPITRKSHKVGNRAVPYTVAHGIYPTFAQFDRIILPPNCYYSFDLNANIEIRASRPILKDEILTVGMAPRILMDVDHETWPRGKIEEKVEPLRYIQ